MEKRWILITNRYEGVEQTAINLLYGAVSAQLNYVLPVKSTQTVTAEDLEQYNALIVGCSDTNDYLQKCVEQGVMKAPKAPQGYSLFVGDTIFAQAGQMAVIHGFDEAGVLYGCMDFINRYMGDINLQGKDLWTPSTYENTFERPLNPWSVISEPAVKRRGIWTWGHVIYDYRGFFENMARLRLNEVVIWNDVAPVNAREVVECAHRYNVKVIWGFAWGWGCRGECKRNLERYGEGFLAKVKEQVLSVYETQYADTGADGIYFQSFTELTEESVNGKCIAQMVTELVNDIAGTLLNRYPNLHIQFGLHATSVRNRLEHIARVDPRVAIVWEDCGSFPYDYWADTVTDFDETVAFTRKIINLRGDREQWGCVLKGMLKLDWIEFEHFAAPYVLGERSNRYLKERQRDKNRSWKRQQAGWLKNADYVTRMVREMQNCERETVVQALVEDAMLENEIIFPVAFFAELLWERQGDTGELMERVSKYPCVNFANL